MTTATYATLQASIPGD